MTGFSTWGRDPPGGPSGVSRTGSEGGFPKDANLSALVKVSASRGVTLLIFFKHKMLRLLCTLTSFSKCRL